jgi:hypothetical protein
VFDLPAVPTRRAQPVRLVERGDGMQIRPDTAWAALGSGPHVAQIGPNERVTEEFHHAPLLCRSRGQGAPPAGWRGRAIRLDHLSHHRTFASVFNGTLRRKLAGEGGTSNRGSQGRKTPDEDDWVTSCHRRSRRNARDRWQLSVVREPRPRRHRNSSTNRQSATPFGRTLVARRRRRAATSRCHRKPPGIQASRVSPDASTHLRAQFGCVVCGAC